MHRWVALLALAACEATGGPQRSEPPPVTWVYPPPPSGFPRGLVVGRLGRSQAPQPMPALGIAAAEDAEDGLAALRQATAWPVPGDQRPARAVVYGAEADRAAIDLIDIDAGRVVWRDRALCAAPVVAVTAEVIVCADAGGTRAIGLDGALRWATPSRFVVATGAVTGDRIVAGGTSEAIILDAASGDELARVALPRGVAAPSIVASCGRELLAHGGDGRLVRVADVVAVRGPGKPPPGPPIPSITWSLALGAGAIQLIDACDHDAIVVAADQALIAIARTTGAVVGRIDGVRGFWAARDGSDRLEVATASGVASYPRDLGEPPAPVTPLPALGELLATRGDRRLVRASPRTAVLLDRTGVRGYLPLAVRAAVLGDGALIATGSPGETLHRFALPARARRHLRLPAEHPGLAADAELRDLPPVRPLDPATAVALPDTGRYALGPHAIDPRDGAGLYAVAIDVNGERAAVARADLAARRWRWQRVDGCGPGAPVAIAVAGDTVVCGATGSPGAARATVRATSRDGAARWQWTTDALDDLIAGGDVVAVHAADRLTVLDARDGTVTGQLASDDGGALRAAIVPLDGDVTLLVTAERGRVVARLGVGGLIPVWSIAVAGTVRALAPAGAGVLVALEDGDAYRIDAQTQAIAAIAGVGLHWQAAADLVSGDTRGGPIPAPPRPIVPARPVVVPPVRRPPPSSGRGEINAPPPMSTPIEPLPALGDSWQLTLYEPSGGLRARNDYALAAPVATPAIRGPAGSPLVVAYGPELREVVVIDPRTGDPLRRIRLPDDAPAVSVFGTVVDGSPVAGAVLPSPLRVVLF